MFCPTCSQQMVPLDVPKLSLALCKMCNTMAQELKNGQVIPVNAALEALALGDDRMLGAVSKPRMTTLRSAVEVFATHASGARFALAEIETELRELCAKVEHRLDFSIQKLAVQSMVSDEIDEAVKMLREARDLISVLPPRARGIKE